MKNDRTRSLSAVALLLMVILQPAHSAGISNGKPRNLNRTGQFHVGAPAVPAGAQTSRGPHQLLNPAIGGKPGPNSGTTSAIGGSSFGRRSVRS